MSEEGIKKAEGMLDSSTRRARSRRSSLTAVSGVKADRDVVFIRNNKQDIANAKLGGYSPVLASENKEFDAPAADKQTDGTFILGDTIAMEIPKKLRAQQHKAGVDRMDRTIRAVKDNFHKEGLAAGVATFEDSDGEPISMEETKKYAGVGRKLFAMGATFDQSGNLIHQGKTVLGATDKK